MSWHRTIEDLIELTTKGHQRAEWFIKHPQYMIYQEEGGRVTFERADIPEVAGRGIEELRADPMVAQLAGYLAASFIAVKLSISLDYAHRRYIKESGAGADSWYVLAAAMLEADIRKVGERSVQ